MSLLRNGARAHECPTEQLVVNAVLSGRWPDGVDDGLVAHARDCVTCREVANVALLLRDDNDASRVEMHVPAAGQVWARALGLAADLPSREGPRNWGQSAGSAPQGLSEHARRSRGVTIRTGT